MSTNVEDQVIQPVTSMVVTIESNEKLNQENNSSQNQCQNLKGKQQNINLVESQVIQQIKKFEQDNILNIRKKTEKFENQTLFAIPEEHFNNVLFIMGDSRSGKSTTFLSFKGQPLISISIQGERDLKVQTDNLQLKEKIIGHGEISKTKQPNVYYHQKTKTLIVDCPGLNDSNGLVDEFLNKFYIMKLFLRTKNARFLLVIPEGYIILDNKKQLKESIQGFFKYFNLQDTNAPKIISHTSLLVSKAELRSKQTHQSYKQKYLLGKIDTLMNFFQKSKDLNHYQLFKHFKNNCNLVYIFERPLEEGQKVNNQETFLKQNDNQFLKINYKEDINYTLRKIQNPEENQEQKQKMKQMAESVIKQIRQILIILDSGITQCFNNKDQPKKCQNFKNKVRQFVQTHDIYQASKENRVSYMNIKFKQISQALHEFSQILFLNKIYNICVQYQKLQNIKQRVIFIIKQFASNFFKENTQFSYLYNFLYILYKNFDELEMIRNIFPQLQIQMDNLQDIIKLKYNIVKLNDEFIEKFNINNSYKLEDATKVIQCLKQQFLNISFKQFETAYKKEIAQTEQINKKYRKYINKIVLSIAKISCKVGDHIKAFQVLEQQRKKIQEAGPIKEEQVFSSNYVQIYHLLGNIAKKNLNRFRLAIEYFKTIKQFNQAKIIYQEILSQLQQADEKMKVKVLRQYSQFLLDIGKYFEAQNYLEIAKQLTIDKDERMNIVSMIKANQQSGPTKRKQHIQQMSKETQPPNESLIQSLVRNEEKEAKTLKKRICKSK